jgi:hypothetical protein
VSEVSRLGRNYKMGCSILKKVSAKKSWIYSISENLIYGLTKFDNKKFIHKLIDAEKESLQLSMRIKNTHNYIKKNGGYLGKPPFGYKIVKNIKNIPMLQEKQEDFKLIDEIVNLTYNCSSYNEISNIMNNKNLLYKNKSWTPVKIKNILVKFFPEHTLLTNNIMQDVPEIFDVDVDNDNNNNDVEMKTNDERVVKKQKICVNEPFYSSINLRCGKIINFSYL